VAGVQAAATFAVVLALYTCPIGLTALWGLTGDFGSEDTLWLGAETVRDAVVWMPPSPGDDGAADAGPEEEVDDEPVEPLPAEPAPDESAPTEEPADAPADEPVEPASVAEGTSGAVADGPPARRSPRSREQHPHAGQARRVASRPAARRARTRAPLTAKQQRKRARRAKRRERRAERKQCAELIDQLVQVDDDSWWVGRELINCYRTHPQQFVDMGGAWWHEEKGRKRGVRIHVSSRARGDVARRAGFRRGDIIRSINGVPIRSDFTGALAATQLLRGRGRVRLIRDGEKRMLSYEVVGLRKLEEKRDELAALAAAENPISD
jgi:hypothetical protein